MKLFKRLTFGIILMAGVLAIFPGGVGSAAKSTTKFKLSVSQLDSGGTWATSKSSGGWTFTLADGNGLPLRQFSDEEDLNLETAEYIITFSGPTGGGAKPGVRDFTLSANGNSDCKQPDGTDQGLWLSPAEFSKGTMHACAFLEATPAATPTPTATPTKTPTATATAVPPTATPTSSNPNATITVNFPGLSSVHVYVHANDGVAGTATGAQVVSATWKNNLASLTAPKGTYDIRVVGGPSVTIIDGVDCASDCTVDVPLATLSVTFPGLASAHVYAHVTDGAPSTYGAQAGSSTWKHNSTSLVLLRGVYDVRVVHGPTTVVLDNIDCTSAACSVAVPLATLTVNFPGLASVHSYTHQSDGVAGTYGVQDSSSTWKNDSTSMVLLQATYDVRVVHGPMQTVFDAVDCRTATCSVTVPVATLTVNFPGLTGAHIYAHKTDGATGTYGAEDSSSTWKDNSTSMTLLRGAYDVRVVHGPMTLVFDNVDCQGTTCVVDVPLAKLTVNFPGLTSAHSYAHKSDGAAGTFGPQDSSSTWKDNLTSMTLLQGVYDVRLVHGPMTTVLDDIDCRAATCVADVPLAALSVSFPGHSSVHTYVKADDNTIGTASGTQDSSATWKSNGANFVLLRGLYDVLMVEGSTQYIVDAVDCRTSTCSAVMPSQAAVPVATATPSPTPTPAATKPAATVSKTFVSADDTYVTWRLAPSEPASLMVWDLSAVKCEAFGGANCGDIESSGSGSFTISPSSKEQYLLVYQPYEDAGEACKVVNVADWAANATDKRESVTASYECSGAPTMGWALFGLFAAGAASMAWIVQRKFAWSL